MIYEGCFAAHTIRYRFIFQGTEKYMLPYIQESDSDIYDIMASEELIESNRPFFPEDHENQYVEYKSLIDLTSRALLPYNRCMIHAVAFMWHGYAWLFTGPSGVGKTTQYKNWKRLFRDEIHMVCGDMPVLEKKPDGDIWVHPSPWNGKERIKGNRYAPLGGIVMLEQSQNDSITIMTPEDCAVPLFLQLAVLPENEEQICKLADLENCILYKHPVWKLKNNGDIQSAQMAAQTFMDYLSDSDNRNQI